MRPDPAVPARGAVPAGSTARRAAELNARYRHHGATAVLERAMGDAQVGRIALVSSFGAESVVLLHMLSVLDRAAPVLFIDTAMLFAETLDYQRAVAAWLGLTNVQVLRPDPAVLHARDPYGALRLTDPDACCALRKTAPLHAALRPYDAWITGRKRFQGGQRIALDFFEDEGGVRLKVNPLAHWTRADVRDYMVNNRLPRHPLVAQGYPSIGCKPCTGKVGAGEDARAGRWRGRAKVECGIHLARPAAPDIPQTGDDTMPETDLTPASAPVIVTDDGFAADDWTGPVGAPDAPDADAVALPPDADPEALRARLDTLRLIVVEFPGFADGRGFTIARRLRLMGYAGRLRARGHVIADQYTMARRVGFDEVEISAELAARQPAQDWRRRAGWQAHDYQSRLRA